ncbi:MAG: NAD(P)-dependent oxidoreductase [Deferribacterota bacterium]|nr:NAD(P)-dependent oxidoreductase [Deferribacterota bacterium]
MKRILITGASGFIGSNLLEALQPKGYKLYALVRDPSKLETHNETVEIVKGDLTDSNLKLPEVDYVYHIAGVVKAKNYREFYDVNYIGTVNLVRNILKQKNKLKGFFFLSTLAINGGEEEIISFDTTENPKTHYAKSKLLAEYHLLKYSANFPIIIVRPTAVYGPGERELLKYFKFVKNGYGPILNKNSFYSFIFIVDLVNILLLLLEKENNIRGIVIASDGKKYLWDDVVKTLSKKMDIKPRFVYIPKFFVYVAAAVNTLLNYFRKKPSILTIDKIKEIFKKSWFCDISDLKNIIGYNPVYDLDKGLDLTLEWYKSNRWL